MINDHDICDCDCHYSDDVRHIVPCCYGCTYCEQSIKAYCLNSHEANCTLNPKRKIKDDTPLTPKEEIGIYYISTFDFIIDSVRLATIPIGFVMFSPNKKYLKILLPKSIKECPKEISSMCYGLITLTKDKVEDSVKRNDLPLWKGDGVQPTPYDVEFWNHLAEIFCHSVLLSKPKQMAFDGDPNILLESMFKNQVTNYAKVNKKKKTSKKK